MMSRLPVAYPVGSLEQQAAQKREQRIHGIVLASYFAAMFALAFGLPERFQEMKWIMPLVELSRQWLPNLMLVAARASEPERVEAYLVLGLTLCFPSFIAYAIWRPPSASLVPLESWLVKILSVAFFLLFSAVMSAFWWNPVVSEFKMGPWEGRFGAMMAAALSGRLGMATLLNLAFCLGPLLFATFLWMGITKPVKPTADFRN